MSFPRLLYGQRGEGLVAEAVQRAVAGVATIALMGCAHFDSLATQVAQGQLAGSEVIRREGAVAFALCRTYAAYAYFETALKPYSQAPIPHPQSFDDWYDQAPAETDSVGRTVTWSNYCAILDRTGDQYNAGVVALGGYAEAIQSLTKAKTFDASRLSTIGSGVGAISASFGAPSTVSSTAADIGSAASSLAGPVMTYVRTRETKKLLSRSHPSVVVLLRSLDAYLGELDNLREVVVMHRARVLKEIAVNSDPDGGFTPAAFVARAYDLGIDAGYRLDSFSKHIAADRALLASVAHAQDALADAANGDSDSPAKKAAERLSALIAALGHQRPEEP